MNIEKSLDIIKGKLLMIDKMLKQDQEEGHGSAYEMQTEDFEAIEALLTAYEKEKEKNKEKNKFERILVDDFKRHIESITIGESITFPCGWVYKKDLLDLINDIKWEE